MVDEYSGITWDSYHLLKKVSIISYDIKYRVEDDLSEGEEKA